MDDQDPYLKDDEELDVEERNKRKTIAGSLKSQWNHPERKKFLMLKIAFVIIGLALLILNSAHNFIHKDEGVSCFEDVTQNWLLPLTKYFKNHESPRNSMIILSSTLVDICMTSLYLFWLFYGKSLRLLYTIAPFYIIRGLTQRIFAISFPDYFIFQDPGFFSITVPYFKTNDFFFSGHVGVCTFFFLEYRRQKFRILEYTAFVAIFLNFFVLLVTRGHFIIDLVFGIVMAHYMYLLGLWIEGSVKGSDNPCLQLIGERESESADSDDEENYRSDYTSKIY